MATTCPTQKINMKILTREYLEYISDRLKPFDATMHMLFQGVESPCPMYFNDGAVTVIIDGSCAELYIDGCNCGAVEFVNDIKSLE